eukprot:gnl/TRDRNA2_/TRDRNA2_133698_c0_seq1.p1 gnl/TRDRNA2_/TRDRNA2_133698_c0~~gnl/TRDRNA2_/TRDRNA2_133698_c0_seq1.p1  ORF type:complete len:797 (+),score=55.56 gnl/TRDRNA2_/TRDRNA2_133698_c0_seq1:36-2393(+)
MAEALASPVKCTWSNKTGSSQFSVTPPSEANVKRIEVQIHHRQSQVSRTNSPRVAVPEDWLSRNCSQRAAAGNISTLAGEEWLSRNCHPRAVPSNIADSAAEPRWSRNCSPRLAPANFWESAAEDTTPAAPAVPTATCSDSISTVAAPVPVEIPAPVPVATYAGNSAMVAKASATYTQHDAKPGVATVAMATATHANQESAYSRPAVPTATYTRVFQAVAVPTASYTHQVSRGEVDWGPRIPLGDSELDVTRRPGMLPQPEVMTVPEGPLVVASPRCAEQALGALSAGIMLGSSRRRMPPTSPLRSAVPESDAAKPEFACILESVATACGVTLASGDSCRTPSTIHSESAASPYGARPLDPLGWLDDASGAGDAGWMLRMKARMAPEQSIEQPITVPPPSPRLKARMAPEQSIEQPITVPPPSPARWAVGQQPPSSGETTRPLYGGPITVPAPSPRTRLNSTGDEPQSKPVCPLPFNMQSSSGAQADHLTHWQSSAANCLKRSFVPPVKDAPMSSVQWVTSGIRSIPHPTQVNASPAMPGHDLRSRHPSTIALSPGLVETRSSASSVRIGSGTGYQQSRVPNSPRLPVSSPLMHATPRLRSPSPIRRDARVPAPESQIQAASRLRSPSPWRREQFYNYGPTSSRVSATEPRIHTPPRHPSPGPSHQEQQLLSDYRAASSPVPVFGAHVRSSPGYGSPRPSPRREQFHGMQQAWAPNFQDAGCAFGPACISSSTSRSAAPKASEFLTTYPAQSSLAFGPDPRLPSVHSRARSPVACGGSTAALPRF